MELVPYVGLGPIRFGMTRDDVRAVLGPENPSTDLDFLHYSEPALLSMSFDAAGRCHWIAVHGSTEVTVDGIRVRNYAEVLLGLYEKGHEVRFGREDLADSGAVYCDDLGLYLWREDTDTNDLAAIGAYGRHYWERTGWPPADR